VGGRGDGVIRLAVRVARSRAEVVAAELLALSPGGLEERDVDAATVELAIYGASGELPDVGDVRAVAGSALVEVSTSEVADDWAERWREWHRPIDVGPLRVRPPWAPARDGALDVVIEPGQAFGTGAHATTRLCLELLVSIPAAGPLADWGCGSGVLTLAAARLGFDPVFACDVDPLAVAATVAAARANGIGAALADDISAAGPAGIVAARHDLRSAPGPPAPTVVANLVRPLLLEVAAGLDCPPERLIASGLEAGEVDEVAAAFSRHGLALSARRDGDGWSAILLTR
jgi:ribosomal protein L11 methyltransferase